jgi:hypothetical protein
MDDHNSSSFPTGVEQLLASTVLGGAAPWLSGTAEEAADEFFDAAQEHGVAALLAHAAGRSTAARDWPERLRDRLRTHHTAEVAREVLRRTELERVLSALARGGVSAVLMKGAPLAYSHYPHPWLRPRVDTDLLIELQRRSAAFEVMTAEGYSPGTDFSGELVTHQHEWERVDRHGLRHVFDIHTRVANPHLFARVFEFPELVSRATPVPALGPAARGLDAVDAVLLAAMHRVAHHYASNRLIWLYDVHLLVGGMDEVELRQLVTRATSKRIRAVTADAITVAGERFGAPMPPALAALAELPSGRVEATAWFLDTGRTKVDILLDDLRVLNGWRAKVRLILEHLFPPAAYIRQAYAVSHPVILPLAYTHRILTGVAGWFKRH